MRLPKGFGKNYFRLSAITATTNQISLNANSSRVENFYILFSFHNQESKEIEDELLDETFYILEKSTPSHCNCYYFKKTLKTLLLHAKQNYFFNYFKYLNNAISPPTCHTILC